MRKVINISNYTWEYREMLQDILNVKSLPRLIIVETVEEDD